MTSDVCDVASEIRETIRKNRDNLYSEVAREMLRKHKEYCQICRRQSG
jgi:hypothetical protein